MRQIGKWPALREGEVHVWHAELDRAGAPAGALDPVERARAARFRRAEDARLFRFAHATLRRVLGGYLSCDPAVPRFARRRDGKPVLHPRTGLAGIEFNLSHSGRRVAIALSRRIAVGVDIERVRPHAHMMQLAQRFFAPDEVAALEALSGEGRIQAFFRLWALKEAVIKMTGQGLAQRLDSFSVLPLEGAEPGIRGALDTISAGRIRLETSDLAGRYHWAVSAAAGQVRLRHFVLAGPGAGGAPLRPVLCQVRAGRVMGRSPHGCA
ncbi:MAG: 4'-phosphopantetheinyl transferase superfamily protein [Paenirhodobacter sp.]|uniref:4'-phosphopantetheinyl transferase family protein n=1 Tax=Paenirhodobacter sp. TaxID=1965326 RepID=UPI003D13ADF5